LTFIYENNYKKKHPFTANSYVYFGKYYLSVQKYDSALYWFQKSLIANSKHFNDNNILKIIFQFIVRMDLMILAPIPP